MERFGQRYALLDFENDTVKALLNIWHTYSHIRALQNKIFNPAGITPQQFNILKVLSSGPKNGLSITELKDLMVDRTSNVSRLVEKLRAQKLLDRTHDKTDRRMVNVKLRPEGKKLVNKVVALRNQFKKHVDLLKPEEAEQLNYLLDKFRHNMLEGHKKLEHLKIEKL